MREFSLKKSSKAIRTNNIQQVNLGLEPEWVQVSTWPTLLVYKEIFFSPTRLVALLSATVTGTHLSVIFSPTTEPRILGYAKIRKTFSLGLGYTLSLGADCFVKYSILAI